MIRIAELEGLGDAVAAMTDRADGDCALRAPDPAPRDAALHTLGLHPSQLAVVRQVHGDVVRAVSAADLHTDGPLVAGDADALITDSPGILLGISVADCIPVFLLAPGRAVGLAHAGREGSRLGIAATMVRAMATHYGLRPEDLHAHVGPGAGPCCYEVTHAMGEAWRAAGLPGDGRYLDLWATNRQWLREAGIAPQHLSTSGHCTICNDRYFSYRRDGTPARNLALLGRTE